LQTTPTLKFSDPWKKTKEGKGININLIEEGEKLFPYLHKGKYLNQSM
jgi:hypothetical protein